MMAEAGLRRLPLLLVVLCGACQGEPDAASPLGGQLRLGAVLGDQDLTGYAVADRPRTFRFPADHGPHPRFRSEWWYLTAVLAAEGGAEFGVQFTLFRQAVRPESSPPDNPWQTAQIYLAHFALTDVAAGRHRALERFARGHPRLAGVAASPFRLWLEDWVIEAEDQAWQLRAGDRTLEVALRLDMERPVVLQGDGGLSRKGEHQASYYYSVPAIPAAGTIRQGERTLEVAGRAWLDREWSTSMLEEAQVGWDWFAVALDQDRSAMFYQLRRADGARDPHDAGVLIGADGARQPLEAADIGLLPRRYWTDPRGDRWPIAWDVELAGERFLIEALVEDQLMDTTIRYWEGLVAVYDDQGARRGSGYLEMTGYGRVPEATGSDAAR